MEDQERKRIFHEELFKLLNGKHISSREYEKISFAYSTYYKSIKVESQAELTKVTVDESVQVTEKAAPPIKFKKQLSSQELRERNITSVLIVGVILILLSGVVLATSNWEMLTNAVKTVLIILVSVLFFGISVIADKVLKIEKTAFAFWVLGSLFLPVAILSAGFFQLFGNWLSVMGEGKYVLGVIGAVICIPVYLYSSERYKNRLFVWISYITITIGVYNFVAAFRPKVDLFFFAIVIYNSIVIAAYMKLKPIEKYKLYTKELQSFLQVNLAISTMLVLAIFNNNRIYGFNTILLALLYIFIVYSEGRREYFYIFSGLITYGLYQVIEHTNLGPMDLVLISTIGVIFIGLKRYKKTNHKLNIAIKYVNGIITIVNFVYITIQAIIAKQDYPTFLLIISYAIISANYVYLSYTSNKRAFNYSAPIFLVATGLQVYRLLKDFFTYDIASISIFIISLLLFFLIYYKSYVKFFCNIRKSSGILSYVLIAISVILSSVNSQWILTAFILYFSSYMLYLMYTGINNKLIQLIIKWNLPLNILLGTFALYGEVSERSISLWYDEAYHFGFSVLVLFLLSFFWKRINSIIGRAFFALGHLFMPFTILFLGTIHYDNPIIFIIPSLIYLYSTLSDENEITKRIFLYGGLITDTLTLASIFTLIEFESGKDYIMLIMTVLIAILWYVSSREWKRRITPFFLTYSIIGLFIFNVDALVEAKDFLPALLYVALIMIIMHKEKLDYLLFIPLFLFLQGTDILCNSILIKYNTWRMIIPLLVSIGLRIVGQMLYNKLYSGIRDKYYKILWVDWYSIFAVLILISTFSNRYGAFTKWFNLIVLSLISSLIYSQINRVDEIKARKIIRTLAIISLILPYYKLIDNIQPPSIIIRELNLIPWILAVTGLHRIVWKDNEREIDIIGKVNSFVIILTALILLKDVAVDNYLLDRLILGVVALIAIFIGMQYKIKIYFFTGILSLLTNVLIQTKELWLNIPWWGYLLISGLILIAMASYNEMQKNKEIKNRIDKNKLKDKFKDWK